MALSYIEELGRILKEKPKSQIQETNETEENDDKNDIKIISVKTENL